MRVFITKLFDRRRRNDVTDKNLISTVKEMEQGTIHANLGGGLTKQRVARDGAGKSGGFRTLIAYREGERAIFLHIFAKNDIGNISEKQKEDFRKLAKNLLKFSDDEIQRAIENKELKEIVHEKTKQISK